MVGNEGYCGMSKGGRVRPEKMKDQENYFQLGSWASPKPVRSTPAALCKSKIQVIAGLRPVLKPRIRVLQSGRDYPSGDKYEKRHESYTRNAPMG